MANDASVPVVGIRLAEGRSGSTLLMQLLASSPEIVFDDRYPSEYRFLSYFGRVASMMTEPFDEQRHVGVTPFFFGDAAQWGPVPFSSDVVEIEALRAPMFGAMWDAWSQVARSRHPSMRYYVEKLAIEAEMIAAAAIPLRVIDLVRDPRDVLASINAFTRGGMDGFGRSAQQSDAEYVDTFVATFGDGLERMQRRPVGLGNPAVAGQAAFLYSLMRPSHRVVRSGDLVAVGADWAAPVGGRWLSERCGRWSL